MKPPYNKWLIATIALTTLLAPTGLASPAKATGENLLSPAAGGTFVDLQGVSPDQVTAITQAAQLGLIHGDPSGHFRPTDTLTRQELAVLLTQALQLPLAEASTHFSDVDPNGWGSRYIEAVRVAGIMQGDGNGTFRPNDLLTREELAVLLIRASQQPLSSPLDSAPTTDWGVVASWAQSYVRTALNSGSMTASEGRFLPHQAVARQEIAAMMLNTFFPTDRAATLLRVEGDQAWINGVAYRLTDHVKGILNPANAKVLQGAKIKFDAKDRTLNRITSLQLQASGTASAPGEAEFSRNLVLDGNGATVDGDLVLAGDFLSVINLNVAGDFQIGPELENDFYSYHLNVQGKTKVRGGDDNTVVFNSSSLSTVEVNKTDVHVEAQNDTVIQNMIVSSNASIVSDPSASLQQVTLDNGAHNVDLQGSVQQLVITGNQEVTLTGKANINTMTVNSSAPVTLNNTGQVGQLQVTNPSAKVQVGQGLAVSNLSLGAGVPSGAVQGLSANSDPAPVNTAPVLSTPLPIQTFVPNGNSVTLDLSQYFTDAEDPTLAYTATSANQTVVTVVLNGSLLTMTPHNAGNTSIAVKANDGKLSAGGNIKVTVTQPVNQPPVVDHAPTAQALTVGAGDYTLDLSSVFSDPDHDALTFTATSDHPAQATATLNGSILTVHPLSSGTAKIDLKANDGKGGEVVTSFDVTINEPPTVDTLPAQTLQMGAAAKTLDLTPYLHDTENDTLTVTAVSVNPSIATTGINGHQLTLTPVAVGQTDVTLTISDGHGGTTTAAVHVTVDPAANRNPVVDHAPTAQTLTVGTGDYTLDLSNMFSDPDGDALTLTATSLDPSKATATLNGTTLTVHPLASGTATIELKATDGRGGEVMTSFVVTVNEPPTVDTLPAQTLQVGAAAKTLDLTPYLHDAENDTLTVTAVSADPSLVTTGINGHQLTLTPVAVGQTDVTLTVSDGRGGTTTATVHVTVDPAANRNPVVDHAPSAQTLTVGTGDYTLDLSNMFSDPDGDALTLTATSLDPSKATATLNGTTLTVHPLASGTATIELKANDGRGGEVMTSFVVTVNEPPTVDTLPAQTLQVGAAAKTLDLSSYLHDAENDTLTVTAVSADSSVVTTGINGHVLTLTPVAEGQTDVTLTVSDGRGGTTTATVHVNVTTASSNQDPTVVASIYEQVLTAGVTNPRSYDLSQLFSDPDGDALTYEITSSPSTKAKATITGAQLTLEPGTEAGSTTVTITARDGKDGEVSYNLTVRTAPLVANGNLTITTKTGISGVSVDLSTFFPGQTSFTVYQGTPDSTFTGPTTLNGKIWNGAPNEPLYTWVIGADGTAVAIHVVQKPQGAAQMFFSQYLDLGNGNIAVEFYDKGDGDPSHKSTGYSLEVHQYYPKTDTQKVITRNFLDNFPNSPFIVINSIFYDYFDILDVAYFNDEVMMNVPGDFYTTALVLKKGGQIVDVLGDLTSKQAFLPNGGTLIRKKGIYTGSQAMSLYGEWDIYPKGTLQYFGKHTI